VQSIKLIFPAWASDGGCIFIIAYNGGEYLTCLTPGGGGNAGFGASLNVAKLKVDNIDPKENLVRLEQWRKRAATGVGIWRVINDLKRLETILAD